MALLVTVTAEVTYTCRISDEDEFKIREYIEEQSQSAEENSDQTQEEQSESEDGVTPPTLEEAIWKLYFSGEIDLHQNSVESFLTTNNIEEIAELQEETEEE